MKNTNNNQTKIYLIFAWKTRIRKKITRYILCTIKNRKRNSVTWSQVCSMTNRKKWKTRISHQVFVYNEIWIQKRLLYTLKIWYWHQFKAIHLLFLHHSHLYIWLLFQLVLIKFTIRSGAISVEVFLVLSNN